MKHRGPESPHLFWVRAVVILAGLSTFWGPLWLAAHLLFGQSGERIVLALGVSSLAMLGLVVLGYALGGDET